VALHNVVKVALFIGKSLLLLSFKYIIKKNKIKRYGVYVITILNRAIYVIQNLEG